MNEQRKINLSHHRKHEYCTNRLQYRDGRRLTAVKVYTIANESKHLLVFGVPRINLLQEVKQLFGKLGAISKINAVTKDVSFNETVDVELFTDCYHVAYQYIRCARKAKLLYDRKSFYGGILHVSYAPEHETLSDLREKFEHRKKSVAGRLNALGKQFSDACDGTGQMTNAVTKRHRQQINEQSMKSGSGFGHKY